MLMLGFIIASLVVSFVTSLLCAPIVRSLAPVLGLVDHPGRRKVHVNPTPMGGGVAVLAGMLLPTVLLWCFPGLAAWVSSGFGALQADFHETIALRRQITAIGTGAIALFAVGLADDRWNLPWKIRLLVQLGVAVGVASMGLRATVFVAQPWIGFCVTVLWIIVLTNALNFLDNMDGLSAGISLIACMIFATILLTLVQKPHWVIAFWLLVTAGSLAGFLCWNRPPASIFMGDCGSNLTGFLLATLTISGTFYHESGSRHVILAPLCVLAVPLYDFCTVILIRLGQGRSPFHGDKSHFSHRLVDLGLHPIHAVLTIYLATLMTGLGGLLLYKVPDWTGAWMVIALIFCVLSVIAILETIGRRSSLHRRRRADEMDTSPIEPDTVPEVHKRESEMPAQGVAVPGNS